MAISSLETEDAAWQALASFLAGTDRADVSNLRLSPGGWAKMEFTLNGEKFHSTITPPVMEALLALQTAINRSAALLIYNVENANRLTDEQKEKIEIVAFISKGSSEISVDGSGIINHLIDTAGAHMNGTEIAITVLGALVLYFGHSAFKIYIESRAKIKESELSTEQDTCRRSGARAAPCRDPA